MSLVTTQVQVVAAVIAIVTNVRKARRAMELVTAPPYVVKAALPIQIALLVRHVLLELLLVELAVDQAVSALLDALAQQLKRETSSTACMMAYLAWLSGVVED